MNKLPPPRPTRQTIPPDPNSARAPRPGRPLQYSAPSAGPPPWYVYEFSIEDAYAVMTEEPGGATRWTF
jgi:hypothetical protein